MKLPLIWFTLLFSIISPSGSALAAQTALSPAVYYQIEEPFILNFQTQSQQKVQYLQIKVALMSHDTAAISNAESNLPMIQDALRTLFSQQSYDTVSSLDGRQQLQQQALTQINALLEKETSKGQLDQLYFTSFILQ